TLDEYRQHIEKDAALERRFQPVLVGEPTVEDTIAILRGLKERYELHHNVRIQDGALIAAATLSQRYIADRFLPDKAIDLIDKARVDAEQAEREANLQRAAELRYGEIPELEKRVAELEEAERERADGEGPVFLKDEVDADDVAEVVARWTGIPVSRVLEGETE